jgi:hypothetical protein
MWSSWWNQNWQGKPKYSEKTCPDAILFISYPTWFEVGPNRASAVRSRRLTSWAMARPLVFNWIKLKTNEGKGERYGFLHLYAPRPGDVYKAWKWSCWLPKVCQDNIFPRQELKPVPPKYDGVVSAWLESLGILQQNREFIHNKIKQH